MSITWGYTTTPSAATGLNPLTVFANFENPGQKLVGPHKGGTWVKVDYTPNSQKESSISAGIFNVGGGTEINASARYWALRLTWWKNSKDEHPGGSIGINIGNSSSTFTVDNGKFAWGADISLSPTVNIYGGFSWEVNQNDTDEPQVSVSELWWYKTLQKNGHMVVIAAGYNPTTKTLSIYVAIVL